MFPQPDRRRGRFGAAHEARAYRQEHERQEELPLMTAMDRERSHDVALLLVDVINDFDFPGSQPLISFAEQAAPQIRALADRARDSGVPVIYVNDNFGHWRSDFRATVERCSDPGRPAAKMVRLLAPERSDLFVLKPMHSGFFHTPLELLLRRLQTKTVVACGFAANLCVAFTAYDAYMRGLRVVVPQDTTAANSAELCTQTLRQLAQTVGADTRKSAEIDFAALARVAPRSSKPR